MARAAALVAVLLGVLVPSGQPFLAPGPRRGGRTIWSGRMKAWPRALAATPPEGESLGLGSAQRISIGTDQTDTMRRVVEGLLYAEDAEAATRVLGENVKFLLSPKTPERFTKAKVFFPQVDAAELDEVFRSIVDFLEEFVHTTASVERSYQEMMRELLEAAQKGDKAFDSQLNSYGAAMNFEFLTYLDGQMDYLSKRNKEAPDADGTEPNIALLRMLRVRVNAMLDEAFGPYFAELTRVLAIEDDATRRRAFLNSSWIEGSDDDGVGVQGGLIKLLTYIKREMEEGVGGDSGRDLDRQILLKRVRDMLDLMERAEDPR